MEIALRTKETILERNALEAKRKRVTSAFTTSTRTSGGSSFRGTGFQRGSYRGRGLSRPSQSSTKGSGREDNRRNVTRGRFSSIMSTPMCNKCGRYCWRLSNVDTK